MWTTPRVLPAGRARLALLLALGLFLAPAVAAARGGGGCIEEGTRVATPDGEVPVEALRPGAPVWSVVGGRLQAARVMAVTRVEPEEYVELEVGFAVVRLTPEHPVQIGAGVFDVAEKLSPGETLFLQDGAAVRPAPLVTVRRVKASRPAFNLLVQPGGTFLAGGVAVHNKGCFLPDTPITRADGSAMAIRDVRPGDALLAFTADGAVVTTTVREVIEHDVDEYVELTTEHTALRVTREHPFFVGDGRFETMEALRVGDRVHVLSADGLRPERIVDLRAVRAPVHVYNLRTDRPNTYFASGVAVHNKGGGGFRSSGGGYRSSGGYHSSSHSSSSYHPWRSSSGGDSSGGGGSGWGFIGFLLVCVAICAAVYAFVKLKDWLRTTDLDFRHGRWAIERKAKKTGKLLEFLARVDPEINPAKLRAQATETFLQLQKCWEARAYEPMKPLLMPGLYGAHVAQLGGMRNQHEINRISGLKVDAVDLVNVRYPQKENQREFTALVTATARDHYVDDRTFDYLRGDAVPAQFQEFWTFQRQDGAWLLREIEQTRESSVLREENYVEQLNDFQRDQLYGDHAGKEGPAGPGRSKSVDDKGTRIERLLASLVQTDPLWDRQAMLERSRKVFLDVTLSREQGDPARLPEGELFPDVAAALRAELERMREKGLRYQFRNLCVRKADLVLVRNFSDNRQDEFTVRISAHAQRGVERGGHSVSSDADVTAFTQFWTFGRLDGEWKLKEILPEARGEEAVRAENLDEDGSPAQTQWCYQQTRAN